MLLLHNRGRPCPSVSRLARRIAFLWIGAVLGVLASYGQGSFSFVSSGTNVIWQAPAAVDSTAPAFSYTLSTTQLDVLISAPWGWRNESRGVPAQSVNAQGYVQGPVPVELFQNAVNAYDQAFSFNFHGFIGADGYSRLEILDLVLGQYTISINGVLYTYDVLALRAAGTFSVTAIPEPSPLWLLAAGVAVFSWFRHHFCAGTRAKLCNWLTTWSTARPPPWWAAAFPFLHARGGCVKMNDRIIATSTAQSTVPRQRARGRPETVGSGRHLLFPLRHAACHRFKSG